MKTASGLMAAIVGGAIFAAPSDALVLCKNSRGVLALRDACRSSQAQVDATTLLGALPCPPDAVKVGAGCVDKYEASVWRIPDGNPTLIEKVKAGTATVADLTDGGAMQVSATQECFNPFPSTFDRSGNWTAPLYAASVAGVEPTACVTWFQANQACGLSGKRLLRNDEWQQAAAGTPDGAPCIVNATTTGPTGTPGCVSNWGTFDMVGNVDEWVADWVPLSTDCPGWGAFGFSDDKMCLAGASTASGPGSGPGALRRGGFFTSGSSAGVFAVTDSVPSDADSILGFRCTR